MIVPPNIRALLLSDSPLKLTKEPKYPASQKLTTSYSMQVIHKICLSGILHLGVGPAKTKSAPITR